MVLKLCHNCGHSRQQKRVLSGTMIMEKGMLICGMNNLEICEIEHCKDKKVSIKMNSCFIVPPQCPYVLEQALVTEDRETYENCKPSSYFL